MLNKKYFEGLVTKTLMSKRKTKRINFFLTERIKREVGEESEHTVMASVASEYLKRKSVKLT